MKKLTQEQIDSLLKDAETAVEESRSLSTVFGDFAVKTGRAKGGIRNLYYAMLKESRSDDKLRETYPSLNNLKAERNKAFSKDEEDELFERVSAGVKSGKSVRRTIGEMACGDEKIALRYQNKYRNIMKKKGLGSRYALYKDESDYKALRRAVDDLFERIIRKKSEKENELKKENQALRQQIELLKNFTLDSKTKKFFLQGGGDKDVKNEKVPE